MGRSENEAARRWHQPEREKLVIQPALASRPAMIPHGYNETSSQPVNDLGGVPAVFDSFGKASARRGYVAVKLAAACNMPWFRKEPAGGAWQIRQNNHDYFSWHQAYCGAPDAGFQNAGGEYEPIFT